MTLTKEQLIAAAHSRIEFLEMMLAGEPEPLKERALAIELQLARMALAGMESEPVAWTDAEELRDALNGGSGYLFAIGGDADKFADPHRQMMLYTAPQTLNISEREELENYRNAQQVVPGELTREEYKRRFMEEDNFDDTFRGGWSAYRAAMQSGAVKDGWVACSERMPEGMKEVIISNGFDIGHGWWDGEFWQEWSTHDSVPGEVTHWQPLPAAPDFREIGNSSTKHFRENSETSTNCPCCGRKSLKNRSCSVDGCDGKHVANGLCKKHYDIERKKDPSRRDSLRAADERYRARKSAAPQQEAK